MRIWHINSALHFKVEFGHPFLIPWRSLLPKLKIHLAMTAVSISLVCICCWIGGKKLICNLGCCENGKSRINLWYETYIMSFLIRFINQQGFGRTRLGVCFQIQIILIIQIRVDNFGDSSSGLGDPRNHVKRLQRFLTTFSWSPIKNWARQVPVRGGVYSNKV